MGEGLQLEIVVDERRHDADFRESEPNSEELIAVLHEQRHDVAIFKTERLNVSCGLVESEITSK